MNTAALGKFYEQLCEDGCVRSESWPLSDITPESIGLFRDASGFVRPSLPFDVIDRREFLEISGCPGTSLTVVLSTRSTNTDLMDEGRESNIHLRTHLAEHQIGGRGRRGRNWISPLGRSLSISVGYESSLSMQRLQGISLVAGVALCSVFRSEGGRNCRLKWPNDVLFDHKKVSGILVEHQNSKRVNRFVVGVGINTDLTDDEKSSVNQPVCNVTDAGVLISRTKLAALVVKELFASLATFERSGFGSFRDRYVSMHALHDRDVRVQLDQGAETLGVVRGIGDDGSLIVETPSGLQSFVSGEVSVRKVR